MSLQREGSDSECSFLSGAVAVGNAMNPRAIDLYGAGTGQIVRGDLLCGGNESRLVECSIRSMCAHDEDAGLICQDKGERDSKYSY